jgi:hypothetical protein
MNRGALDAKLNCPPMQRSDAPASPSCRIAFARLKASKSELVLRLAVHGDRSPQARTRHAQRLEPCKGRFRRPGDHNVPTQDMRDAWRLRRNGSRSSGTCCWRLLAWGRERDSSGLRVMVNGGPTRRHRGQTLAAPRVRGTVSRSRCRRGPPASTSMLATRFRVRGKCIWKSS